MSIDEQIECEQAVFLSPKFLAVLKKHYGNVEPSLVMVDIWSGGTYGDKEDSHRRLARPLCFLRSDPTDNGYARPIEGIRPVVDPGKMIVLRFETRTFGLLDLQWLDALAFFLLRAPKGQTPNSSTRTTCMVLADSNIESTIVSLQSNRNAPKVPSGSLSFICIVCRPAGKTIHQFGPIYFEGWHFLRQYLQHHYGMRGHFRFVAAIERAQVFMLPQIPNFCGKMSGIGQLFPSHAHLCIRRAAVK